MINGAKVMMNEEKINKIKDDILNRSFDSWSREELIEGIKALQYCLAINNKTEINRELAKTALEARRADRVLARLKANQEKYKHWVVDYNPYDDAS